MSRDGTSSLHPLVATAVGLALVATLVFVQSAARDSADAEYLAARAYDPGYYVPRRDALPWLSLGYDDALADLLWMKALVYYGEELVHRASVEHAFDYAEAILTLAPDWKAPYLWAGSAGIYRPSEPDPAIVEHAVAILERAAARFPTDGEIRWELGATLAYELAPLLPAGAHKDDVVRRGTHEMEAAARLGAGPSWLVLSNVAQLKRLGERERAIAHLEEMYDVVRDSEMREQIRLQLGQLRGAVFSEAFVSTNREVERERRSTLPYVSPDLYVLLRATRPSPSWRAWLDADEPGE